MLEVDEVAAQPRQLPGVPQDRVDVADLRLIDRWVEALEQELGEPGDRRQRVPELVGDVRHRHRLVHIDLGQLGQHGPALGDVPGVDDDPADVGIVEQRVDDGLHVPPAPVGGPDTDVDPLTRLAVAAYEPLERLDDEGGVVGVHVREDAVGRVVVHALADEPEGAGARPAPRPVGVEDGDDVLGAVQDPLDRVGTGEERRPVRVVGIGHGDGERDDRPVGLLHGGRLGQAVLHAAACPDRPERAEPTPPLDPVGPLVGEGGSVVGMDDLVPEDADLVGDRYAAHVLPALVAVPDAPVRVDGDDTEQHGGRQGAEHPARQGLALDRHRPIARLGPVPVVIHGVVQSATGYPKYSPPLTSIAWPVIGDERSEAKKTIDPATSSSDGTRFRAIGSSSSATTASGVMPRPVDVICT